MNLLKAKLMSCLCGTRCKSLLTMSSCASRSACQIQRIQHEIAKSDCIEPDTSSSLDTQHRVTQSACTQPYAARLKTAALHSGHNARSVSSLNVKLLYGSHSPTALPRLEFLTPSLTASLSFLSYKASLTRLLARTSGVLSSGTSISSPSSSATASSSSIALAANLLLCARGL